MSDDTRAVSDKPSDGHYWYWNPELKDYEICVVEAEDDGDWAYFGEWPRRVSRLLAAGGHFIRIEKPSPPGSAS